VCSDQSFNVLQAINACCAPQMQNANCSPLRYNPPAECQNMPQHWCITIQYQEQQSKLVTPLRQVSTATSSCADGSVGGCGCNRRGAVSASSTSASAATQSSTSTSVPVGACEATRIVEGFQLGVIPAPQTNQQQSGPQPGSFGYQFENCLTGLQQLAQMAPPIPQDVNAAYQAVCSYLTLVNQYFAKNQFVVRCQLLDQLAAVTIPPPASVDNNSGAYQAPLQQITNLIGRAALDCLCTALLPVCPPDPCDNRLILACVTVQNGTIVDICPFEGRQQLIGYTALNYWLGAVFKNLGTVLDTLLQRLCCGEEKDYRALFASPVYAKTNLTSDVLPNPALVSRIFTTQIAQKMGAEVVNAISESRAVNMQKLVGGPYDEVSRTLEAQKFTLTQVKVDEDPSWDSAAIAAAPGLAPAAVSSGQPLTLYTKGNVVVSIAVTDSTTVLFNQVANQFATLQAQVNELKGQVDSLRK
jgi:hypothetical protein